MSHLALTEMIGGKRRLDGTGDGGAIPRRRAGDHVITGVAQLSVALAVNDETGPSGLGMRRLQHRINIDLTIDTIEFAIIVAET